MSEIKNAGYKGYLILGAAISLLLFVFLVVYIYKGNNERVPQEPLLYGSYLVDSIRATLTA